MKNLKILIVDDDSLNVMLYYEMLKQEDYELITAADGMEALQQVEKETPDLIILDWNMPRLNGMEVLKVLKNTERTKEIPVIMITGLLTSSESLKNAMDEGAIEFLRKPFDKIEFKARVRTRLLLSKSTSELAAKYQEIVSRNNFIHSLIESVLQPLIYYTSDGIILGCNRSFEKLMEKSAEELRNKMFYLQCTPGTAAVHMNADLELLRERSEKTYETKMGPRDQDFIFSKSLFYNCSGKAEGILCIMTDVTEIKKIHAKIMECNKKELVSSALRLIQISEMNNNLISELAKIKTFVNRQGSEMIKHVISSYNIHGAESVWRDFEARFENVYEKFYTRLQQQFPALTPGERKLCALLRLNISTKDIAAITFQNPQSIDTARYRLRKKLTLCSEDNLIDFLIKIDS